MGSASSISDEMPEKLDAAPCGSRCSSNDYPENHPTSKASWVDAVKESSGGVFLVFDLETTSVERCMTGFCCLRQRGSCMPPSVRLNIFEFVVSRLPRIDFRPNEQSFMLRSKTGAYRSSSAVQIYAFTISADTNRVQAAFWRKNDHDVCNIDGDEGSCVYTTSHWMCGTTSHSANIPHFNIASALDLSSDSWMIVEPDTQLDPGKQCNEKACSNDIRTTFGEDDTRVTAQSKIKDGRTLVLANTGQPNTLHFSPSHALHLVAAVFKPSTNEQQVGKARIGAKIEVAGSRPRLELEKVIIANSYDHRDEQQRWRWPCGEGGIHEWVVDDEFSFDPSAFV